MKFAKKVVAKTFEIFGFEITQIKKRNIGRMDSLLIDLKKRGLSCKWIFDIGANRSEWSKIAAKIYSEAKFCLVEPQIEMKKSLELFCKKNTGSTYFLAGAGARKEELTLTVWDDLAGSSLLPELDEKLVESGKQRKIDIVTIDSILEDTNIEIPELIKLDIQGFELEALKGATKLFGITEVFILEVSLFLFDDVPGMPIFSDVINFMLDRDYVVYDFPGFLRRPLDGALGQCDVCFVKKNSFLRQSNKWS